MPINVPIVLKFGGSSVGSTARFRTIVEIVNRYKRAGRRVVVVASALSGVTDRLVAACEYPLTVSSREVLISDLFTRHRLHAAEVLSLRSQRRYDGILREQLTLLDGLLFSEDGVTPATRDSVLAVGERLSIHLLALALSDTGVKSCPKDAAGLIRTDANFGDANVDQDYTRRRIRLWYGRLSEQVVPIITGFIGSTADCRTTTLGRGGSDYSASLVATALDASHLERWTDVDGVYTSDPNRDSDAQKLERIVMADALAWSHTGKMGIHPKSLDPLMKASIPMYVRSIDSPEDPGTAILPKGSEIADHGLKVENRFQMVN